MPTSPHRGRALCRRWRAAAHDAATAENAVYRPSGRHPRLCYRDNVTRGLLNVTVLLPSSVAVKETWTKPLVRPAPRLIHGAPHASAWARTRLLPGPQK